MLRQVGAAHARQCSTHQSLVLLLGRLLLDVVVGLMVVSCANPVHALTLAGPLLLVEVVGTWLLSWFHATG